MAKHGQNRGSANRAERRRLAKAARKAENFQKNLSPEAEISLMLTRAEEFREKGKLSEAEAICRELVMKHPNSPTSFLGLGTILEQQERVEDAYHCFKQAVTMAPNDFQSWRRFGNCLYKIKQFAAALIAYEKAIAIDPDHFETLIALVRTLANVERPEDALKLAEGVAEKFPDSAVAFLQKGLQHQILGDKDAAREALEHAVELDPDLSEAHFRLAEMGRTTDAPEDALERLRELGENQDVSFQRRAGAYFSAAKLLQKQKRSQDAFELYRTANNMLRDNVEFEPENVTKMIDASMEGFSSDVFEQMQEAASDWDVPIFIVGMPRSGTTLTEQIISSHPDVCAGGEERKLAQLVETLMREESGALRYPADVGKIEPQHLVPIGTQYRKHMQRRFPDAHRITDKNPFNFYNVGLISILFPKATILHCHRDPMDTCLSCYFQFFGEINTLAFTNDLQHLGHYYNAYKRLMRHWHEVLPGRVMDVCYEEMVADQEAMSRKVIDHVGLPWDDACLRFDENERGVRTASQWQVRQPIYHSSIGRWREFESQLEPLREVLDQAA